MGRGKKITAPLTEQQRAEARDVLAAFRGLSTYVEGQDYLEHSGLESADDSDGAWRRAHQEEAALAVRKRDDALAEVLDVLRGRPYVRARVNQVMLHGSIEDAVDSIERLRTPWRTSIRARALRSDDRQALPADIQFIQQLQGLPIQTKRRIRAHLKDAIDDPPEVHGRRGSKLTSAAAILAELVGYSATHIERIVRARRKRKTPTAHE